MALITVIVVLASMALLMTGVYTLVFEGSKSGKGQVRFELTRDFGENGLDQLDALIRWISRGGAGSPAPANMGYQNGWNRLSFAALLRQEKKRSDFSGVTSPCTQDSPDLRYSLQGGEVILKVCVQEAAKGGLAGTGSGVEHGRVSGGGKSNESGVVVTVWAEGPQTALAQFRALGRTVY